MKGKWYRANITKAILLVVAHIMVVVMTASALWILAYPALRQELFQGKPAKEYKDTQYFAQQMRDYSHQVMQTVYAKKMLETDGKYNPERIVDLETFYKKGVVSGKNSSGLAYKLGDLINWYDWLNTDSSNENGDEDPIIVCQQEDGAYDYYRASEFEQLLRSKEYRLVADAEYNVDEVMDSLKSGYDDGSNLYHGLKDREGRIVYKDFWIFTNNSENFYTEKYAPVDGKNMLALVNEDERWNGRLADAYNMLEHAVNVLGSCYMESYDNEDYMKEGDTNFTYLYVNAKSKTVYTNKGEYGAYDNLASSLEKIKASGKYVIVRPKLADFQSNLKNAEAESWRDRIAFSELDDKDFVFAAVVDTKFPIQDHFYAENNLYSKYGAGARSIAVFGISAAVLFIISILWLVVVAGRSNKDSELHMNAFDGWKTEIAAAFVILLWFFPTMMVGTNIGSISYYTERAADSYTIQASYVANSIPYIIVGCVMAAFTCFMFLVGLLSLVRRIKGKTLWKNSLLRIFVIFIKDLFHNLNCIWKTVLLFGAFVIVHWFVFLYFGYLYVNEMSILVFLTELTAFVYLVYGAIGREKIKKGIKNISRGEVDYKIKTEKMIGDQKEIAEDVNSIGDGLEVAVEKSMKSERLKTDLITNVSHDIKTPLTSIINYVNLLKQENFEDPKIQHYIEVLEQKSLRLKNLTEDVVEASKVSSGNITLEYMNLNFTEMVQQVSGEIEEKFKNRNLKEVLSIPDEEIIIKVDGRRTWRILENIYSNAAKYAMEGTRVYAELKKVEGYAVFNLKNISEQPLNISADELTERFIRGDISRSTEGSGLGLSIARTLTEMQGGTFDLYLDGDLFKVTVKFAAVEE